MEPIAIVGIGCRFPGAENPEAFWQLLCEGGDAIAEVPPQRWDIDQYYDPEPGKPGKMSTRWGGFLDQVDGFDASFFGISPREVERMDPQQRLVLEVAWEAIENAGIAPDSLSGSQSGVFMGIGNYDYCRLLAKDISQVSAYDGTGNTLSIAANRLSYTLNLRGPSVVVETACSSSLVAVHFACRSLQSGETNLCLVGGASLMLSPEPFITYSHARMMAADGRCKTFDARADGYVRGEGCGVVVLKRLSNALKEGDRIQGVIRGTAINQDGQSNGLTAPNGPSQQAVIRLALNDAGVTPDQISYVEAHGTGTSLGDPIEFKSLKAVLMPNRPPDSPCWIGSVKTNIGHLEAASGIASIIKVVLALQHQEIPPHLHFQQVNPYIALAGTTFAIPTERQPWTVAGRRLAGISAFGFGGTNCHVVMEEAHPEFNLHESEQASEQGVSYPHVPMPMPTRSARPLHVLTLSAKTEPALHDLAAAYQDFFAVQPEVNLADVCFTANTGRSHFDHRLAVVAESVAQMQARLKGFVQGDSPEGWVAGTITSRRRPKVAFLFTGQGSQYVEMGRELYETQPVFRQALERCDRILRPHLEQPLLSVLYPKSASSKTSVLIDQTAYTQPALFALEYALVQLWQSWGIEPSLVMGHSVGEYVAACVAGVFSLEDGLKLIAARARLMQALPPDGAMVAVFAGQDEVQIALQPYTEQVAIAAINGPQSTVISGEQTAVAAVVETLHQAGLKTKALPVSHAFHSPLMEPMLAEFEQVAADIQYAVPHIKLISNLTGEVVSDAIATPDYWCRHIRQPVQFAPGMAALHQAGYELLVEIGPKPILLGMGRHCWPDDSGVWLPSLHPKQANWQTMLQALATLYGRGVVVDWAGFDQGERRHRLALPTYPFQRQRYWVDLPETNSEASPTLPTDPAAMEQLVASITAMGELSVDELKLLPKLLELVAQSQVQGRSPASAPTDPLPVNLHDWLYDIQWQVQPRQRQHSETSGAHPPASWLIFADAAGTGAALAEQLQAQGHTSLLVYPGHGFERQQDGIWRIDPTCRADCDRLLSEVATRCDRPLQGIIHLWNADAAAPAHLTLEALEQAQTVGIASVLHLVQALAKGAEAQRSSLPRLWLVTQGAVVPDDRVDGPPTVAQSAVWGLGRVIALEHRDLWGGLIDLPPVSSPTVDIPAQVAEPQVTHLLLTEIQSPEQEDHLAFRQGQRYVARLGPAALSELPSELPPESSPELPTDRTVSVRANATYLITGGLGALGLQVALWLVEQGARHLVLTGRRAASESARVTLGQLERAGVRVLEIQADVASEADVERVMATIQADLPPLRGVIHAAGVLDDGILLQQTWERFTRVMAAKVQGSWNLHHLTQEQPLDFFVLFSSAAALLGSPGQGNYATANAFMDGLAHYRHSLGLPALSLNWGAWQDSGMAASLDNRHQARLKAQGIQAIATEPGLQVLTLALRQSQAQLGVLPFDWSVFMGQWPVGQAPPLLAALCPTTSHANEAAPDRQLLQRLQAVSLAQRQTLLMDYLRGKAAQVLGLAEADINPERSLHDLGLDSLMAVELTTLIRAELQVELPIRALMEDPSLETLVALITEQMTPGSPSVQVSRDTLDLGQEAVLDEAIHPAQAAAAVDKPTAIFLTGATGFLGAFLLQELLDQTQANIFCLVRATDIDAATFRLQQNLKTYGLWQAAYSDRIVPILGDLAQPQLGIAPPQFEQLAERIDVIYHNGAMLNYVYPYAKFKPINVLGTQEVLRLACHTKIKPVHHVSSVAALESSAYYNQRVTEADPIDRHEDIYLGYSQSKWVSEKLVQIAGQRGLPVTIYRPPLVSGHSQTGTWNTTGFLCRMIKGCIQMGSIMSDLNLLLDLSPVDYNSRAMVYLSQQKSSLGKAFHLQNPHLLHWHELTDFIGALGYPIQRVSYEAWQEQLSHERDNPLYPLLPFFRHQWSNHLTYIELNEQGYRPLIDCEATLAALAGSDIVCPPLDAQLLATYFDYFLRSGFLQAPKVAAVT
ncbi:MULTISPECIES: type I polyketide synthase [Cyanophyceae]|uniref:type I polyketide synthase n=1 Tax=Cyanophyceae TaxID=3028117 RepID=UPI0018EF72E2|nr:MULTISPECIES: type I polyketide synthase [unclassified Phormidium]